MLDLCSDHSLHRVLVPIPVLSASIDDCTVGALNYISGQRKSKISHQTFTFHLRCQRSIFTLQSFIYIQRITVTVLEIC